MKIGFIGVGKMASAIIKGLDKKQFDIIISGRELSSTQAKAQELDVAYATSHAELVEQADIIILGVKPQVVPELLNEISPVLGKTKTIVSIAAGLDLHRLAVLSTVENLPIIRIMPNINAMIGQSTSAIVANDAVSHNNFNFVKSIFENVGSVHEFTEKDFSAFTALAGSSPAYIYIFIDALARAGVLHGIPKAKATAIVAETVQASAKMILDSGENPWELVDKVSSPGGTTVAGVVSLEQNRFVGTVIDAISATIEKEKKL